MTLHGFGNWSLLKEYKFRDLPEKSRTCVVGWYQALHKRDWVRGYRHVTQQFRQIIVTNEQLHFIVAFIEQWSFKGVATIEATASVKVSALA